jgi:hypothetical protein
MPVAVDDIRLDFGVQRSEQHCFPPIRTRRKAQDPQVDFHVPERAEECRGFAVGLDNRCHHDAVATSSQATRKSRNHGLKAPDLARCRGENNRQSRVIRHRS